MIVAHTILAAAPERVWPLIRDTSGYAAFMPGIRSARVIANDGDAELVEMVIAMPFPLPDLRAVTRTWHDVGPDKWERRWVLEHGDYHHNSGAWTMTRAPEGTAITYRIDAHPKLALPPFLTRFAQERAAPKLFDALRRRLG